MTIYFDGIHLATDGTKDELDAFAKRCGLLPEWCQGFGVHVHYDVWGSKARRAIELGAQQVDANTLVERCYPERIAMLKRLMSLNEE